MTTQLIDGFSSLTGLVVGSLVGLAFGAIQSAAHRRYEKLQQTGTLKTGWAVMPGSFKRVAYLLVALALVQFLCPLLFAGASQWWVSAGVALGYGWQLFRQLRQKQAEVAADRAL